MKHVKDMIVLAITLAIIPYAGVLPTIAVCKWLGCSLYTTHIACLTVGLGISVGLFYNVLRDLQ